MAWEEDSCICLNMQLIAILSRIGVSINISNKKRRVKNSLLFYKCSPFPILSPSTFCN